MDHTTAAHLLRVWLLLRKEEEEERREEGSVVARAKLVFLVAMLRTCPAAVGHDSGISKAGCAGDVSFGTALCSDRCKAGFPGLVAPRACPVAHGHPSGQCSAGVPVPRVRPDSVGMIKFTAGFTVDTAQRPVGMFKFKSFGTGDTAHHASFGHDSGSSTAGTPGDDAPHPVTVGSGMYKAGFRVVSRACPAVADGSLRTFDALMTSSLFGSGTRTAGSHCGDVPAAGRLAPAPGESVATFLRAAGREEGAPLVGLHSEASAREWELAAIFDDGGP